MEQDEPHLHFREFRLWIRGYDCPTCDASKNFWGANRLVVEAKIHTSSSLVVMEPSACLNTNELASFSERLGSNIGTESSEDWEVHFHSFEDEIDWCVYTRGDALFFEVKLSIPAGMLSEKHVVQWRIERTDLDDLSRQLKRVALQFPVRGANL